MDEDFERLVRNKCSVYTSRSQAFPAKRSLYAGGFCACRQLARCNDPAAYNERLVGRPGNEATLHVNSHTLLYMFNPHTFETRSILGSSEGGQWVSETAETAPTHEEETAGGGMVEPCYCTF